jgi:hypothetical protein
MGFNSVFYGSGNKPHFVTYSGSCYTTQTYCELPQFKPSLNMTTQFSDSISGYIQPLAEYKGGVFSGEANGYWIYKLYKGEHLVGVYQFVNQVFCVPVDFDRVEGYCTSIPLTPAVGVAVIPSPAPLILMLCGAAVFYRRKCA